MSENARTYPTYPIPAVGALILNAEHILLVQRGQAPAKGKWTLPGGVVELGESPEDALIREIKEECHLDITIQGIVKVINKIIRDDQENIMYHYVILDYLAHCQSEQSWHELSPQPGSDVMNVRWVPLKDIASSYDVTEGLLEVIHDAIVMQKHFEQRSLQ